MSLISRRIQKSVTSCLILSVLLLWSCWSWSFEAFVIDDIRVEGLQRISVGTVFSYLPFAAGERVEGQKQVADAIRALFGTGFFEDVEMAREGQTLIIRVRERPAISSIQIVGNTEIKTEDLRKNLKDVGLSEGLVLDRAILDRVKNELQTVYMSRGLYNTQITATLSPLERNRVGVRIDIIEGSQSRIREVRFVGNSVFPDDDLLDEFELKPRAWYAIFSSSDKYARDILSADLDRLSSYYQDRGYVNFAVTSTQVTLSPDFENIFVTVNMSEGEKYVFGDLSFSGDLVVDEAELRELIQFQKGEAYSRSALNDSISLIRDRLGDEGYAFVNVNPIPSYTGDNAVDITLFVDPGKKVYVRQINISGNSNTDDRVIRRELRQIEGAPLSSSKVKRSKQRLDRLGFFERVNIDTQTVPGASDEVDLEVEVEERLSGNLQLGAGFSDQEGVILSFSLQQDNFLGTGDRVNFSLSNSESSRRLSTTYTERFYTKSGVSRTFVFSYEDQDAEEANLAAYSVRNNRLGVNYLFPLSETDNFSAGVSVDQPNLTLGDDATSRLTDFVDEFGDSFVNYQVSASWSKDTLNRALWPTKGFRTRFSGESSLPGSDLTFYKLFASHKHFFEITDDVTFLTDLSMAYGDAFGDTEKLPFYENFYAGGISTVRGYKAGSLSLRDVEDDRPIGGNFRILGSVELRAPLPGLDMDSVRMLGFIDSGYAYDLTVENLDFDNIRVSTGVGLTWLSPVGALTFSLAKPLNEKPQDEKEHFQFSLGQTF